MGLKISNLPAVTICDLTDIYPMVQSGVTYKATCTQLQTLLKTSGSFVITAPSGNQVITTGNLQVSSGTIISGKNAGGQVGSFVALPTTAASGFISMNAAINAAGDFGTTLLNSLSQPQSQQLTIPNVASNTGNILAAGAPLVSGNLVKASGTLGAVADSGLIASAQSSVSSVTITSAQFNGMYATPVLIVPAQGANTLIVIDKMELILTYGSAPFASGGIVAAQYDSTIHGAGVLATNTEAAADFFQTSSSVFVFNGVSGDTVGVLPFVTTVNKGIYLSNITGAFTTGTGSSFMAKVYYRVVSTV